jgi:putative tricarboxylic transport membrane protein
MTTNSSSAAGPRHKVVEAGIAVLIALFGVIVIIGSVKAGINWGAEGPRAGFFPFYIGIFIVVASAINFWHVLRDADDGLFAEWIQLRQVMSVVIPTAVYVGAMPFTGLYLASLLFIGYFMRWLGKYRWVTVLAVAFGMPIITYFIFERYFMVPLPKGPVEDWLGI